MCSGSSSRTFFRLSSQASMVCPSMPKIRSMLILSKPAALASSKARSVSSVLWVLPSFLSTLSSKLCAPRLRRFTPMALKPLRVSLSTVPGLASSVTSRPSALPKVSSQAFSISLILMGSRRLGVPPPKYMESGSCLMNARSASSSKNLPKLLISLTTASVYFSFASGSLKSTE